MTKHGSLSDVERRVCHLLGLSEAAFAAQRDGAGDPRAPRMSVAEFAACSSDPLALEAKLAERLEELGCVLGPDIDLRTGRIING